MRPRTLLSALALVAVACGGPVGPFSGGALEGPPGPERVADWTFVNELETVQLEVRPGDPYSVNTWAAGIGPRLYVPTSMIRGTLDPTERAWVAAVEADPAVRVRIDGAVYERTMVRVVDAAEFDAARAQLEMNYEIVPEDRDPDRVIWIYRLDERPASG